MRFFVWIITAALIGLFAGRALMTPFMAFEKLNRASKARGIPYNERPGAQLFAVLLVGSIVALCWFASTHGALGVH